MKQTIFLTGFPSFVVKRMISLYLNDKETFVYFLVGDKATKAAEDFLNSLPAARRRMCQALVGDIASMNLGLSGAEFRAVCQHVQILHHYASIPNLGLEKRDIEKVNIEGTRNVLHIAMEAEQLSRFCFYSTAFVAGDREGVILETELDKGQSFNNAFEESKYRAEKLVQRMGERIPWVIFRPSLLMGDSETGEVDYFDGPSYYIFLLLHLPMDMSIPLPNHGGIPLNMIPLDYLAKAAIHIAQYPDSQQKVYHITDPNPLPAYFIFDLIAKRVNRKIPDWHFSGTLAKAFLKIPFLDRLVVNEKQFLEYYSSMKLFNCRNTMEALHQTDIKIPRFETCLETIILFIQKTIKEKRQGKIARSFSTIFNYEDMYDIS